ncbi:Thymidylate synthase [endosymbiont DhMRE of Dentiscutata heterogama]|uniref:thymidylate synthase n=1 Tax=endosymbiont DhMRE of Dentiscutata heterogama TaxID=1609546 RepID=UPI000629D8BF|nr:thymidylate synthase [endosymbiont DhMRE of Dentiscutata heterogama]CFW92757.1 Thymidylate synthase [endosymbiont DhMRE of Dentiscutata heterogama]
MGEKQYLDLLVEIMKNGAKKSDRTGVGTKALFGCQMRFDLRQGFPLLTTKKVNFKAIIHELLWFIKGNTNIKYLVDNGVNIWNEWPFTKYKNSSDYQGESLAEFREKIKNDNEFAKKYGELGPVYGKQWRNFGGVDQLKELVENLKNNPLSRRHILTAWNPPEIKQMLLPPCHLLAQFFVSENNKLSCLLYQRSGDMFLGVPFNIASYSLLTAMLAQVCGYEVGEFIHVIGDAHIYLNHCEQVQEQLGRKPKKLPTLKLNPSIKSVFDFRFEDISLENYESYPPIKAQVAV